MSWQQKTRGGRTILTIADHGDYLEVFPVDGGHYPVYPTGMHSKDRETPHDLLPITPPNEPAQGGTTIQESSDAGDKCAWCGMAMAAHVNTLNPAFGVGNMNLCPVNGVTSQFYTPRRKIVQSEPSDLAGLRRDAERCDDLAAALSDLYAMVNGECPSLLNEDSGGNAELDLRIAALLAEHKRRSAAVDALPDPAP